METPLLDFAPRAIATLVMLKDIVNNKNYTDEETCKQIRAVLNERVFSAKLHNLLK